MDVRLAALLLAAAAGAFGQGAAPGSEPPKLRGETLDGQALVLPDAASGKVALLIVSASKKAGDRTGTWRDHFLGDFGADPRVACYTAALLEEAPSLIRGMIKAGMRSGTPPAARGHVVVSISGEAVWKKYLNLRDDKLPGLVLLDGSGRVRWSYNGILEPGRYSALQAAAKDLLQQGEGVHRP
jgi:hypothetical protein